MGCLKSMFYQIGCFVLIVATAFLGWVYREQVAADLRAARLQG